MIEPVPDAKLTAALASIQPEVEQEASAPVAAAKDYDAIVGAWLNEHVGNSLISRGPVEIFNDLTQRAVPALVAMLKKEG